MAFLCKNVKADILPLIFFLAFVAVKMREEILGYSFQKSNVLSHIFIR